MTELLKKIRDTDPTKTAYKNSKESITYGELYTYAAEYAKSLKRQGTTPVVLYGHKGVEMIVSILACLMAGRAYVPVDSSTPKARFAKITELANTCMVPDDTAYIIFTSGSTGEPKGVPISYANLNNFIRWINTLQPLSDYRDINVLNQASFSFDLSAADLYYSLSNGHTFIALEREVQEDYSRMFSFIAENHITAAVMTPTFMKLCLLNKDFNYNNYPLDCVYFCGETLEPKTVRKLFHAFPHIKIINAYGPTEATSAVSSTLISPEMANDNILPVGDIDRAAVKITIENGEIVLKGKSVSSGYLGGIEGGFFRENEIFCYRTGDLGDIRDGRLYIRGRADSQIKFKGYRIELGEIENVLARIPGITECAVTAKYDASHVVRAIRAFVVSDLTEEDIHTALKKTLPEYMIPKIMKTDRLPVNENGKLDRKRLAKL